MQLPAPTALPMSFATGIPGQAETQLPSTVKTPAPVDVVGEESRAYTLAGQIGKQEKTMQARADQEAVQDELKSGGTLETPEGVLSIAQRLKGKVAPETYENLIKLKDEVATAHADAETSLMKMDDAKLTQLQKQSDFALQSLGSLMSQYDKSVEEKGVPASLDEFNKNRDATVKALADSKMVPPNVIQQMAQMTPAELSAKLEVSKGWQDTLKKVADTKKAQAQAASMEAGGKETAMLAYVEDKYGKDSPEYAAALNRLSGKGAAGTGTSMSPESINMAADRLLKGDTTALQNLGHGVQGSANIVAINNRVAELAKERNLSADDVLQARAKLRAAGKGLDTLATRSSKIDAAAIEVDQFASNALSALDKVSRGDIVPVNDIIRKVATGAGSPEEAAFATYVQSLAGAYASVISRGNPTVNSQNEAMAIINKNYSKPQFRAMVDALKKEAKSVQQSSVQAAENISKESFKGSKEAQDSILNDELSKARAQVASAPDDAARQRAEGDVAGLLREMKAKGITPKEETAAAKPVTTPGGKIKVNSKEDLIKAYEDGKLKINDTFVGPDGVERTLKKAPK